MWAHTPVFWCGDNGTPSGRKASSFKLQISNLGWPNVIGIQTLKNCRPNRMFRRLTRHYMAVLREQHTSKLTFHVWPSPCLMAPLLAATQGTLSICGFTGTKLSICHILPGVDADRMGFTLTKRARSAEHCLVQHGTIDRKGWFVARVG